MAEETKICKTCGRELPLSDFYVAPQCNGGYEPSCKECRRKKRKIQEQQRVLALSEFHDEALMAELRKRGYNGELRLTKIINI